MIVKVESRNPIRGVADSVIYDGDMVQLNQHQLAKLLNKARAYTESGTELTKENYLASFVKTVTKVSKDVVVPAVEKKDVVVPAVEKKDVATEPIEAAVAPAIEKKDVVAENENAVAKETVTRTPEKKKGKSNYELNVKNKENNIKETSVEKSAAGVHSETTEKKK